MTKRPEAKLIFSPLGGIASAGSLAAAVVVVALFAHTVGTLRHPAEAAPLSQEEGAHLAAVLDGRYPERSQIVARLPYDTVPAQLDINAESAILIDTRTGSILYEKNADTPIPPASMTKLVEMYVVFEAIENGEVSLDDIVPLPPESWAINLPSDASIMFLAQGQRVTLDELLLGLAIASGNDASIAVANYICGNMEDFVARMNAVTEGMGLTVTHFVESSGYSEENVTTAREFAAFSRMYVERFPHAIADYHSKTQIRYPLQHNLPPSQQSQGDGQAVLQYNTNKLLGALDGCDGLKTGFIYESGYNLALTAKRGDMRFLSVTMRGPGRGSAQGNRYRTADGTALMEYAFSSFADYIAPDSRDAHSVTVPLAGARQKSVRLVPALDETFTVPFIAGDSPAQAAELVTVSASVPTALFGGTTAGREYGTLTYSVGGTALRTVPLVAERDVAQASPLRKAWDRLAFFYIRKTVSQ